MKKTIFPGLFILFTILSSYAFSRNTHESPEVKDRALARALVINANVMVVLVNDDETSLRIEGDKDFEQQLLIRQYGKRLVIDSKKNGDLKSKGIIYVSARQLGYIEINGSASVNSLNTLQNPTLDVLINGECKLYIQTTGEVKLRETDLYLFEYKIREVHRPLMVAGTK